MTATKTPRRARATGRATVERRTIRVNIVRLVPGTTRLPVSADPDVEDAFRG